MAQIAFDFAGDALGVGTPAGMTVHAGSEYPPTWTILADATALGGKVLQAHKPLGDWGSTLLYATGYNTAAEVTVDIVVKAKIDTLAGWFYPANIKGNLTGAQQGISCGVGSGYFRIVAHEGAAVYVLASTTYAITVDTWYWIRLRGSIQDLGGGPLLYLIARIWADGETEPAAWALNTSDTVFLNPQPAGETGIFLYEEEQTTTFDYISIATAGDQPLMPPEPSFGALVQPMSRVQSQAVNLGTMILEGALVFDVPAVSGVADTEPRGYGNLRAPTPNIKGHGGTSIRLAAPAPTVVGLAITDIVAHGQIEPVAPVISGHGGSVGTVRPGAPAVIAAATTDSIAWGALNSPGAGVTGSAQTDIVATGRVSAPAPSITGTDGSIGRIMAPAPQVQAAALTVNIVHGNLQGWAPQLQSDTLTQASGAGAIIGPRLRLAGVADTVKVSRGHMVAPVPRLTGGAVGDYRAIGRLVAPRPQVVGQTTVTENHAIIRYDRACPRT